MSLEIQRRKFIKKFRPQKFRYRVDCIKAGQIKVFRCVASSPLEAQNRAIAAFGEHYLIISAVERIN